jgi:hypothetical protein
MRTDVRGDLAAFLAALRDEAFLERVGRSFVLLAPGDWPGLLRWAESHGFAFTLQDLYAHATANPAMLSQISEAPHLAGWNLESLARAARG